MAFNTNEAIVAEYYVAALGRLPDQTGFDFWVGQMKAGMTADQLMGMFFSPDFPEVAARYPESQTPQETVTFIYQSVFGREPDDGGLAFWSDKLTNSTKAAILTEMLAVAKDPANTVDGAYLAAQQVAAEAALVDEEEKNVTPDPEGDKIYLTADVDAKTGTDNADTFIADLNQTPLTGSVSNTLATGDRLDGGASTDTLKAQLTTQSSGFYANINDAQPRTNSIEIVEIEAQDYSYNGGGEDANKVYLDAKNMIDIDKIGSSYSDGDLIIENLTTISAEEPTGRNTDSITITMDHTDSFNSDDDASDLTVYFDEDYLLSGKSQTANSLTIHMNNVINIKEGNNPVEGFSEVSFSVGTTLVAVDVSAATSYDDIVNLINAKLAEMNLSTVSAVKAPAKDTFFSMDIVRDVNDSTTYKGGSLAGQYNPIVVTNTGSEDLMQGGFKVDEGSEDGELNSTQTDIDSTQINKPLSVNVELEKVGRDGEGGNLIIGGKDQNLNGDSDEDQRDGISQFDITVLGNTDKPSNLGYITSTDQALETVNIASEIRTDNSYASLTIREAFNGDVDGTPTNIENYDNVKTVNANEFKGHLTIGTAVNGEMLNVDTFTATGGGNVTLEAINNVVGTEENTVTTGAGADKITIVDNGQLEVSTGGNADEITLTIAGTENTVDAGSGDDMITVDTGSSASATIAAGAGNDTVYGNKVSVSVNDGAGDDAVYVQNTGTKAIQTIVTSTRDNSADAIGSINPAPHDPLDYELMYGRTVQVTIAAPNAAATAADSFTEGFESIKVDVETEGFISTLEEYNTAIVNAINTDPKLSSLAKAEIVAGDVVVNYLVDGIVSTVGSVQVEITGDWADLTDAHKTAITNAFIAKYPDSTITEAQVQAAYDAADLDITDSTATVSGTGSAEGTANSVTLAAGNDFIGLSSNAGAVDTLVFESGVSFGEDTVVNFDLALDALDFTDFLADMEDLSVGNGNALSATRIASSISVEAAATIDLTSNEVAIINDFGEAGLETWASMTAADIDAALSGSEIYGNIAAGATTLDGQLVGATQASILMIQNDQNEGEYKVFEVTETTATDAYTVNFTGIVDFGDAIDATAIVV